MQVILIEDVPNLGQIGEQVNVKPGYARNYLLPRGLAISASTKNAKRLKHDRKLAELKAAKARKDDEAVAAKLNGMNLEIQRKVGEQDKLYGSVTAIDVEKALEDQGLSVDRRKILLDEPIKTLGIFEVPVRLRAGVEAQIKVVVTAEV